MGDEVNDVVGNCTVTLGDNAAVNFCVVGGTYRSSTGHDRLPNNEYNPLTNVHISLEHVVLLCHPELSNSPRHWWPAVSEFHEDQCREISRCRGYNHT